jgi:hypothetical protein
MLFVMSEGEGPVDDALNMYYHIAHQLNDGLKERWGDAQQCEGRTAVRRCRSFSPKACYKKTHSSASVPLLFFKGLLQIKRAAIRHSSFATRHSPFVIQKKSPPAFAGGLLKLGY